MQIALRMWCSRDNGDWVRWRDPEESPPTPGFDSRTNLVHRETARRSPSLKSDFFASHLFLPTFWFPIEVPPHGGAKWTCGGFHGRSFQKTTWRIQSKVDEGRMRRGHQVCLCDSPVLGKPDSPELRDVRIIRRLMAHLSPGGRRSAGLPKFSLPREPNPSDEHCDRSFPISSFP